MIKNIDGTYIYLVIPAEFECVYSKLLVRMTDLGLDIIKDCSASCRGVNRQIFNCWNIFQAACTAHELGEVTKANFMINYIKAQLNITCGDDPEPPIDVPSITGFAVNVGNVVGAQTLNVTSATFTIAHANLVKPNSLKIIYINTNTVIGNNLPVTSPATVSQSLAVTPVNTYRWKATIEGTDGTIYESNVYSITCSDNPTPGTDHIMYYGNTNVAPAVFQTLPIEQIFGLQGIQNRTINGNADNNFTINQTDIIHYLLIPVNNMDLIKSEYGTALITTLWNNATQTGAYFTTNPGGTHQGVLYRVFFSYSPSGAFAEAIRITCKNK